MVFGWISWTLSNSVCADASEELESYKDTLTQTEVVEVNSLLSKIMEDGNYSYHSQASSFWYYIVFRFLNSTLFVAARNEGDLSPRH